MKQIFFIVFVAPIVGATIIVASVFYWTDHHVPLTWRTCQDTGGGLLGGGSNCLADVQNLNQIKTKPDGCITDGHNVICGSYWQKKDRW